MSAFQSGKGFAERLDAQDPLAAMRAEFALPPGAGGQPQLYLAGNSLGLQPKRAAVYVREELKDWETLGVEGHFHGRRPWVSYHETLTPLAARLVGASPLEVVHMNTLTVNLHLLMVSFYRPTAGRHRIVIERPAFPSDRYAVVSQIRYHGYDETDALIEIAPREGECALRPEDIERVIDEHGDSVALILLPGVQYYSGQVFDMAGITALGRAKGCTVGFDLAHAAGNVRLALHDWNVDFAAWCTYKYLNSGPGAIGGVFVHERYARDDTLPRFAGWWGHDPASRFRMGPDFAPMPGAEGWQLSNPPILALAPVLASLELFDAAGMDALLEKSRRLTGYFDWLVGQRLAGRVDIITPASRGCQLSLRLNEPERGRDMQAQLVARDVICDWREPDVIRVAPVPLYNRYLDVYEFVETLHELLAG